MSIEFADFLMLSANFGHGVGVAAVPEPSQGPSGMPLLGITMLMIRRKRRISYMAAL